jgi:hypothetical protein
VGSDHDCVRFFGLGVRSRLKFLPPFYEGRLGRGQTAKAYCNVSPCKSLPPPRRCVSILVPSYSSCLPIRYEEPLFLSAAE